MTATTYTGRRRVELIPIGTLEKTIGHMGRSLIPPVINMDETDDEYLIYMALPGLHRENLGVVINNGILTISAGVKENQQILEDRCLYDYTGWSNSFRLPTDAETMMTTAGFRNGELVLHIPKGMDMPDAEPMVIHVY